MGIGYNGRMCVGAPAIKVMQNLGLDEIFTFADDNGLETWSQRYDCMIGYILEDISIKKITPEWISATKDLGDKFENLTQTKAMLFGSQNVY